MNQERRELLAAQNTSAFCLLLLVVLLSGCGVFWNHAPLTIPARDQVDRVVVGVTKSSATGNIGETVINDPERIAKMIDFLNAHNSGWRWALEDPIGPYDVTFERSHQSVFILRI